MATISMLIVEQDERYVDKLALKFLEEMQDEVQMEVITDRMYFEEYISVPRKIDVLMINEQFMNENVRKQNVRLTIVLKEEEDGSEIPNGFEIFKYTNLQEIYLRSVGKIHQVFQQYHKKEDKVNTSLITVYSPTGGCGKTTVALGICAALSEIGKKVLYVNTETVQNFQLFLSDKSYIANGMERHLAIHEDGLLSYLNGAIGKESFDYLKPIHYSTLSYGIKPVDYEYFITKLVESRFYEYVILDIPSQFDEFTSNLMEKSTHIMMVVEQNEDAVFKMERLLDNIDYSNNAKFMFICNRYKKEDADYIRTGEHLGQCTMTEYVDYDPEMNLSSNLYTIKTKQILKSTAYLLV